MKNLNFVQNKPLIPSLFQIAANMENYISNIRSQSSKPPESSTFTDLMLHREKLEAALILAKSQNDAFDASRKFSKKWYNR